MSQRQHTNILQEVSFSVSSIQVIQKRPDFLRAARGQRHHSKTIIVQKFDRRDGVGIRVGFTCSKKVGNAVIRNRAKRRLRAAAQMMLAQHGQMGCDYILIGKNDTTANFPFDRLQSDLKYCLTQLGNKGAK